jgi:hypothetical protein
MMEKVMAKLNRLKTVPRSTDTFNRHQELFVLNIEVMVGYNKRMVFAKGIV